MNSDIIPFVLPSELLNYFEVVSIHELCSLETKTVFLSLELEEKNQLPMGYDSSNYESKGFLSSKTVQDFPLRGKAVYLRIKRRRWRNKQTKEEIKSDYSFIAEGSKLTVELSDFLKGTGRDPGRYDK